jgi:hypothetical protein
MLPGTFFVNDTELSVTFTGFCRPRYKLESDISDSVAIVVTSFPVNQNNGNWVHPL